MSRRPAGRYVAERFFATKKTGNPRLIPRNIRNVLIILCLSYRINAYLLPCPVFTFESYNSADPGIKSVIISLADIGPGMELCAPLSDKYIAGLYNLTPVPFYAQTL